MCRSPDDPRARGSGQRLRPRRSEDLAGVQRGKEVRDGTDLDVAELQAVRAAVDAVGANLDEDLLLMT